MGPLSGYRIIEMGAIGPAPFCGMVLADLGAEVIRVDRTFEPDLGIRRDPKFDLASRGKRSVAIDLKTTEGKIAFLQLVANADALIEGQRPGVMERLGIGPRECAEVNPRLVFGRLTGWGQDGPLAGAAGHDLNFLALTGALDAIGTKDSGPVPPLNLIADYGGGSLYMAIGILGALLERQRSGLGQVVDAAIVDGVSSMMAVIHGQIAGGYWHPGRGENIVNGAAPWNTIYETLDGQYVTICSIESRFYDVLLDKLGVNTPPVTDRNDGSQWPRLRRFFAGIFLQRTRQEWCDLLEGTDVCFAPVLNVHELLDHPHVAARKQMQLIDGMMQPSPAPRFSRSTTDVPGKTIHRPGEHTDEVLAEWGFDSGQIGSLRRQKTIV